MLRYIAIVIDRADEHAPAFADEISLRILSSSPQWKCAYTSQDVRLLYVTSSEAADRAYNLHGGKGAIVGKLFRTVDSGAVSPPVSDDDLRSISETHRTAAELTHKFWGRYFAVFHDSESQNVRVIRDPLGTIPCFTTYWKGLRLFFSSIPDVLRVGIPRFTINWDYIAAQITSFVLECRETGLNEVGQVLGGESAAVVGSRLEPRFEWNPLEIASRPSTDNPAELACRLRDTVRNCVRSWAECYKHILIQLSGGLDSSILATCLREGDFLGDVTCVNYYSDGADSDERHYAREAARAAGRRLVELERGSRCDLRGIMNMAMSSRPTFYTGLLENRTREVDTARDLNASAIFTGNGGDQIFYNFRNSLPAADFARLNGISPKLWSVSMDAARLARLTVWKALSKAIHQGLIQRRTRMTVPIDEYQSLISPSNIQRWANQTRFVHPLLQEDTSVPPAKLAHTRSVGYTLEYRNPFAADADPEVVHPFYSQPIIDLVLQIPTYILILNGWDRGLARHAFECDLPQKISRRRSKGTLRDQNEALLLENIGLARELLLDGQLTKRGILDREKLESVLSGAPTKIACHAGEVHYYLGIEAWAQNWAA